MLRGWLSTIIIVAAVITAGALAPEHQRSSVELGVTAVIMLVYSAIDKVHRKLALLGGLAVAGLSWYAWHMARVWYP